MKEISDHQLTYTAYIHDSNFAIFFFTHGEAFLSVSS